MPDGKPWPKISIVTPSYNQGQFIEETIRSVLLRGYPNLPNGVIESMSCGTPVVSFNVGGVPEAVRHMDTGYLAELGSAEDLAEGIHLLLNNDELYTRLSRRCREIAEREYSLDLQSQRFLNLYEQVVENYNYG